MNGYGKWSGYVRPKFSFPKEAACRRKGGGSRRMTFSKYSIHRLDLSTDTQTIREVVVPDTISPGGISRFPLAKLIFFSGSPSPSASDCSGGPEPWCRTLVDGFCLTDNPQAGVYHHGDSIRPLGKQRYSYLQCFTVAIPCWPTQQLLKESGFRYVVYTEPKPVALQDDPFALPRIQVKNWSAYKFTSRLNKMINE